MALGARLDSVRLFSSEYTTLGSRLDSVHLFSTQIRSAPCVRVHDPGCSTGLCVPLLNTTPERPVCQSTQHWVLDWTLCASSQHSSGAPHVSEYMALGARVDSVHLFSTQLWSSPCVRVHDPGCSSQHSSGAPRVSEYTALGALLNTALERPMCQSTWPY
ncbi:hypothetical protein NDU88_007843 [Pleurodeles waltl]|uniref:Uncharacterized protein n=1 Tax=Pleurodeles waltl TaxID=8319 RepID=A0AAV7U0Y4_PLEWA|nr:hypothetical protein NDU88_007843 [Pleurodeles waltl]